MTIAVHTGAAGAAEGSRPSLDVADPEFFTAVGAAMLPGIHAIARELARHEGERRQRIDDLTPASCDDAD